MQNFLQKGDAIQVPAPSGGVTSGQPVLIGAGLFGVASETVAVGVVFALWVVGVFALPKTSAQAWAIGDVLYWDSTNLVVTNVNSGSLVKIGLATAVAANPSSIGNVRLTFSNS